MPNSNKNSLLIQMHGQLIIISLTTEVKYAYKKIKKKRLHLFSNVFLLEMLFIDFLAPKYLDCKAMCFFFLFETSVLLHDKRLLIDDNGNKVLCCHHIYCLLVWIKSLQSHLFEQKREFQSHMSYWQNASIISHVIDAEVKLGTLTI